VRVLTDASCASDILPAGHRHTGGLAAHFAALRTEPRPPVASRGPPVAPELAAVADRALRFRPVDRVGDAGVVALALAAALARVDGRGPPPTPRRQRPWPPSMRRASHSCNIAPQRQRPG
jgi:hypothetical protein